MFIVYLNCAIKWFSCCVLIDCEFRVNVCHNGYKADALSCRPLYPREIYLWASAIKQTYFYSNVVYFPHELSRPVESAHAYISRNNVKLSRRLAGKRECDYWWYKAAVSQLSLLDEAAVSLKHPLDEARGNPPMRFGLLWRLVNESLVSSDPPKVSLFIKTDSNLSRACTSSSHGAIIVKYAGWWFYCWGSEGTRDQDR